MADNADHDKIEYPLLTLKNVVVFPRTIVNLTIGRTKSVHALNKAVEGDRCLVVIAQRTSNGNGSNGDEAHGSEGTPDLYEVGTLVEVRQVRKSEGGLQVEVEALRRVRLKEVRQDDLCIVAEVEHLTDKPLLSSDTEALMRHLVELFEQYAALNNKVPTDAPDHIRNARQPGYMADLLAAHILSEANERQQVLEMLDQSERLHHMASTLVTAVNILQTEQRIKEKVRASIDRNQREFYLREQLKAIHDELAGDGGSETDELRARLAAKELPEEILQRMLKEVTRLERMPSVSPESTVVRNYIDWTLALPWPGAPGARSEDVIDLALAEQVLEEDHYGLTQVKERILDFLAVRQLTLRRWSDDHEITNYQLPITNEEQWAVDSEQSFGASGSGGSRQSKIGASSGPPKGRQNAQSAILCFVGPPGVGKTSLGQSIARAMNRKFVRLSLGGVHDEAEIRGHRRTYVGAMPGRIIQAMRNACTVNPVMLLDEVDKMTADMRGDPAAALLEVLDPAQNHTFVDHYLDVPYDLSDVLFIATANTLYNIPRALRDRMEVIEIGGYTEEEKIQIARRHLLPKQVEAHGLETGFLEVPDRMLRQIIRTHTREAGVRELERKLATICRKAARRVVQGRTTRVRVTPHNLEEFLGQPRYRAEVETRQDQVGVALGLAWTEHGGELLPVEVVVMPGRGNLTITGRLGDIMQESARAALSYARSRAKQLNIDLDTLEKSDIHIHLPEGAIPKDGPSAGITMATALISAITRRPARCDLGMTGEITLTGRVLGIGGLKEKALAVHRAGIKRLVAPASNKPEWTEMPGPVRREIECTWVETMDQVIDLALLPATPEGRPAQTEPAVPVSSRPSKPRKDKKQKPKGSTEGYVIDTPTPLPAESPALQKGKSHPHEHPS